MYRITFILLFFSFFLSHQALGDDIIFSGEYRDIPFDRFISDIESKKDVHFFYRQEWISGITITAKGDSLSLTGVLQSNLAGTGLNFYIDNKRNVFLTPVYLVSILPEDLEYEQHNGNNNSRGDYGTIDVRQKYFKGQKARIVETIIIGTYNKNISRNRVIINGRIRNKENAL
jgi:hypothetical protein